MWFTYHTLNRRIVKDIHGNVTEKGRQNPLSRLLHAKNDKETIGTWKLDLNRILHVFNVRSLIFTRTSLIVSFQTELAVNTHVAVSDMRHDILGIRSDVSKIQEEIGGQVRSVSASCIQSAEMVILQSPRLKPGQQLRLPTNPTPHILYLAYLESPLPHGRGPASDVTS